MKTFTVIVICYIAVFAGLSYFAQSLQSAHSARIASQPAQEAPVCTADADCAEKFPNINPW